MIKIFLFRGIVERPLNGLMLAMLILSCSLFINPQKAQAGTCSTTDYNYNQVTIAAGVCHTVGVKEDGTVMAVGNNTDGQLNVKAAEWSGIKAVAAGWYHTVGVKEDGTVVATSVTAAIDNYGQSNVYSWTNIKAIAAGRDYTVGLKEDGTVAVAGTNAIDQLNVVSSWKNIKAIAAGEHHTVGVKEDGTVVAAGNNAYYQLDVSSWKNMNIKAVAAGVEHTVGLREDGTVVAAGSNTSHQKEVTSWKNIKAIAAGGYHTVGLREDGTVVAVGSNSYGQLVVSSWKNIIAIAAGKNHTVGLQEDGKVVNAGNSVSALSYVSLWSHIMTCKNAQIIDTTPPVLNVSVTPAMLWPPNHQMVTVTPVISVKDDIDPAPQVKLLSVISNELDNGLGDGDTANDIVPNSNGTISLRAERSGKGSGRIYTITYRATDASGNATIATATATVAVTHNK